MRHEARGGDGREEEKNKYASGVLAAGDGLLFTCMRMCVSADEQTSVHVLTRVKMRFDVVGVQKNNMNPWAVTGDATCVCR